MGKFSDFAKDTKKLESKNSSTSNDVIPAKDKNPDDLEIK